MSNETFFIQLEVDQEWLDAITNFTQDVYDGEVCKWISIQANNEGDE